MNVEMPLVSVVIPTYNCERYIKQCLESLLSQTYKNIEIIVCDDCSTDSTFSILREYESKGAIILLKNEKNKRQAYSRNRCIRKASGDYIIMQDGDDFAEASRVELLLSILLKEDVDFVGSDCFLFDDKGKYDLLANKVEYPKKEDFYWNLPFAHASIMFRRECLDSVGAYKVSKRTKRGEDMDMLFRMYAKGYKGKNLFIPLYNYRVDKDTYSRRDFQSRKDECIIRFYGYKINHILFPIGWLFVFKPILAQIIQSLKLLLLIKKRVWEQ